MKNTIRVLCLLLISLMLLSAVACATETQNPAGTTEAPTEENKNPQGTKEPGEEEESSTGVTSNLPDDLDLGGTTITFISRDSTHVDDELTVDAQNGDRIADAIFDREAAVEHQLNVKIENIMLTGDQYEVSDRVRNDVKAQMSDYQIAANSTYSTIMYTGEKIFRDLTDCEYLELDQPYWSQGFNEAASFGASDAQFLCTGAISLVFYRYMFATFFNRTMFDEYKEESLYSVVNNKTWTLDYQLQISERFYDDIGGDGKDEGDKFGFVSCSVLYMDPYWSSCEIDMLGKDEDNMYEWVLNTERFSNITDKIISLFHAEHNYFYKSSGDDANEQALASHFAADRAAMTTLRLSAAETELLRKMTSVYGIVPVPKYDETQQNYGTFIHDQFTSFGIVNTTEDDEIIQNCGIVLEAMACESMNLVIPEYYEQTLKAKYLNDPESWAMLDLIYDSVYIDPGILYDKQLLSAHQWLRDIILAGDNTVASKYNGQARALEIYIGKLNSGLEAAAG